MMLGKGQVTAVDHLDAGEKTGTSSHYADVNVSLFFPFVPWDFFWL